MALRRLSGSILYVGGGYKRSLKQLIPLLYQQSDTGDCQPSKWPKALRLYLLGLHFIFFSRKQGETLIPKPKRNTKPFPSSSCPILFAKAAMQSCILQPQTFSMLLKRDAVPANGSTEDKGGEDFLPFSANQLELEFNFVQWTYGNQGSVCLIAFSSLVSTPLIQEQLQTNTSGPYFPSEGGPYCF